MSGRRSANTTHDWPFGSQTKRLLIRAVMRIPCPDEGWTASELAHLAGHASPHGSIDDHLAALVHLNVLVNDGGRFKRRRPAPAVAARLDALLRTLERMPNTPIGPLSRRPYRT